MAGAYADLMALPKISVQQVSVMAHEDGGGVAMHMTEEALFAAVLHLDWFASSQSEQAAVNLQTDIFSSAECATHTTQYKTNVVLGERQASGNLSAIFMQPLRCNMQFNAVTT